MLANIRYSKEEKQEIISKLRAAAVAMAEFWDTLRDIENTHGCSIDTTPEVYGMLAGECSIPPSFGDLSNGDVWEAFKADAKITSDTCPKAKPGCKSEWTSK